MILALISFFQQTSGQSLQEVLTVVRNMTNALTDSSYSSYSIRYSFYEAKRPGQIKDSMTVAVLAKGKKMYTRLKDVELFSNDSLSVVVYNDLKKVVISNAENAAQFGNFSIENMDTTFIMEYLDSFHVANGRNLSSLTIYLSNYSSFDKCIITYNSKTYAPVKVSYLLKPSVYYDEAVKQERGMTVDAIYSVRSKRRFSDALLSPDRWVKRDGSRWEGQGVYASYEIINQYFRQ